MIKKRGGQPGNRNALKHGFYTDQFKQVERALLDQVPSMDLSGEMELLRVHIRRYLEAETGALDQMDYETRLQALHTVSLAMASLTRLARTQMVLNAYAGQPPAADPVAPDPAGRSS